MADQEQLLSLNADASGVTSALDQIIAALDDVSAAMDQMAGGSSLADIDASLSEMAGQAGDAAGQMGSLADAENAARDSALGLGEGLSGLMEGLGGVIERAGELAGAFLEFQAIGEVINTVRNFASSMIDVNSSFQKLNITLTNFVGVQQAADITNWAKNFAQTVPFTTQAVQQAVVAVTALGDNAEQVLPALVTIASQMGVDLPTATQALQDAQNGLWRMMERDLHITKDQLVEFGLQLNSKGQVINDSLVPAFEKLAAVKFPDATQEYMSTLSGELSELNDKFQLLAGTMGQPLFEEFQQAAGAALDWLDSHQDIVNQFATSVGQGLATAFKDLGNAIQFAWPVLQQVGKIADGLMTGSFTVLMRLVQTGAQWWHDLSSSVQTVVVPLDNVAGAASGLQGNLSHIPETLQSFTTQVQNLSGPLTPLKQMFDDLGTDLQNIVKFFEPIPDKTQLVTEKVKEWIDTGDGMGKWVSVTKQVNEVTPGQDSPFVQWLESIGDAFSKAFGDDSKHTKLQELSQALQDFVQALQDLATENGQLLTTVLQGLASALGDAAGKLADFFGVLQSHHMELEVFKDTLTGLEILIGGRLVFSIVTSLGGALVSFGKGVWGATQNVSSLVSKYLDWIKGSDDAKVATDDAGESIQQAGEEAQTAADEGVQSLVTQLQALAEQAQAAQESLQTLVSEGIQPATTAMQNLQTQTDDAGAAMETTLVPDADAATTALETEGAQADTTAGQMDGLAASETSAGDAATTAIGTPGSQSGGGLGILGLFFALQWLGQEMQQFDQAVGNGIADWMKKQFNHMGLTDTFGDGFKKANDQLALNQKQMEDLMNQGIQDAINFANSVNESFAGIDTGTTSQQLYNILNAAQVTFAGIKNSASSNLGGVQDIMTSTFSTLTGQGYTWGNNFTQAFANGIASALGSVDNSASQVMQHVHRYVGVESPTEAGPGQRLMEWGPNLVKEFAEGMLSQIGLVGNAAEAIMQQAQKGLTGGQSGGVPSAAYATGITAAGGSNISMARVEALLEQLVSQSSRTPSLGASPAPATAGSVLQQFGNVNLNLPGMDVLSLTSYQNMLAGLAYEYAQRGAINGAAW